MSLTKEIKGGEKTRREVVWMGREDLLEDSNGKSRGEAIRSGEVIGLEIGQSDVSMRSGA